MALWLLGVTSLVGGDSSSGGQPAREEELLKYSLQRNAFAALKEDGSVVTWGHVVNGGNSSRVANQLSGGLPKYSLQGMPLLPSEGGWLCGYLGSRGRGGNSSRVANQLTGGVTQIFSTVSAFAALKEDGSVVTWG